MAASANDKLQKVGLATATTLDSNYTSNDTTVTVASTSGWPTDTGVTFAIDTIDSAGLQVPGSYNEYVGVVSTATSITSVDWADGVGDKNYSAGASTRVYIPVTKTRENRIVDWGLVEHKQDGTHDDVTATSISNAGTLTQTGVASFSDNLDVVDGKAIRDGNDNELVKFSQTASAVNEYTVKNAATGNAPQLQATGGDTNIGINLVPKGTGEVQFNGVAASGAYTDYSSSVTFTNLTKGSGTVSAYYKQVGKRVHYYGKITFAADTTMGTDPQVNVPVNFASTVSDNQPIGTILMLDASGPTYHGGDAMKTASQNRIFFLRRSVSGAAVLATGLALAQPFGANWTTSDVLWWNVTYECA